MIKRRIRLRARERLISSDKPIIACDMAVAESRTIAHAISAQDPPVHAMGVSAAPGVEQSVAHGARAAEQHRDEHVNYAPLIQAERERPEHNRRCGACAHWSYQHMGVPQRPLGWCDHRNITHSAFWGELCDAFEAPSPAQICETCVHWEFGELMPMVRPGRPDTMERVGVCGEGARRAIASDSCTDWCARHLQYQSTPDPIPEPTPRIGPSEADIVEPNPNRRCETCVSWRDNGSLGRLSFGHCTVRNDQRATTDGTSCVYWEEAETAPEPDRPEPACGACACWHSDGGHLGYCNYRGVARSLMEYCGAYYAKLPRD